MLKSIFFILLLSSIDCVFAADFKAIANDINWKNYRPDNFDLVKKLGENAFNWSTDADAEKIDEEQVLSREPYLIFKPHAVMQGERKTKSGIQLYKVKYSYDEHSRRTTGVPAVVGNRNILLLGCSYTLGTGLNDRETFASYLGELRKDFNVYNFGIYGAGANDVLDDLHSFRRFSDVSLSGGIVVYTAIFDHFERSLCSLNCYRNTYRDWVLKKSNYQFDQQSSALVNTGSFSSSRPIKGLLYNLMARIPLFDGINIPSELTDEQIDLFSLMLAEMKQTSKDKLNSEFLFTFYPGQYQHWDRIKVSLKKHKIKFIDLSKVNLKRDTEGRNLIVLDGHPTKLSNAIYAGLLHSHLSK